jgi:hypothetical protein
MIRTGEVGFSLSKSWTPLICSLKVRRKSLSQDSRFEFSAGSRGSVNTTVITPPNLPFPSCCPSSPRYHCSFIVHRMSGTHTPWFFTHHTHPYHFSTVIFYTSATGHIQGDPSYSIVVPVGSLGCMGGRKGIGVLFCLDVSLFPPVSYIIRNFGKPIALLDTCFTLVSCFVFYSPLKMEAICSSET